MEKEKLRIKFIGIDFWNRPIFKPVNKKYYLSDVNNLFETDVTKEEIKNFYADKEPLEDFITVHGYNIDDDPIGEKSLYRLELV